VTGSTERVRRSAGGRHRRRAFLPPQHRLQARHQLARLEGLGQVVIGAQLQSDHAVHHFAAGSEHDDRQVAFLADGPAQGKAVLLGEHDVQDGGVPAALAQARPGPRWDAAPVETQLEAGEVGRQRLAQLRVVVDQQDAAHAALCLWQGNGGAR
jgi:hypothetical protein